MTPFDERAVIEAAFAKRYGTKSNLPLHRYTIVWRERRDRFVALLDCGAYLDAVLTMMPKDWNLILCGVNNSWSASLNPTWHNATEPEGFGFAATPALALLAAINQIEGTTHDH